MQGKKHDKALNPSRNKQTLFSELPVIPDKRYFTIGEVGFLCGVKAHVLRYWEQEFPMLKPTKRRGNRRFYQYEDVLMVRNIRKLLYEEGFTIEGAKAQLLQPSETRKSVETDAVVKKMIADLEGILQDLRVDKVN